MDWISRLIHSIQQMVEGDFSSINQGAMDTLFNGVVGLLVLIAAYFVAKLVSRSVSSAVCRRVDETLGKFLGRLSFYSILISSALAILAKFGVPVAAAMAVLTAAGFAIGLAFQGTLSNFAAGVLLLVFRPFKVGDMVIAAGVTGKVNEIDLFTTTLDTPDNRRMIVPNSAIASGIIENMTYHAHRRVDVTVGVAYAASLDSTRSALSAAAEAMSEMMVVGEKRGYQIVLGQLSNSSVDWTVRFWAKTENFLLAKERLTHEIKVHLGKAGVEIPFPQMQLHISSPTAASAVAGIAGAAGVTSMETHRPQLEALGTTNTQTISPIRPRMRRAGNDAA